MTEITRVSRGELRSDEVVETVEDGGRVIIEVGMLGRTLEMAVRKYDDTYYCDTPVKLLTYDDEEGLKRCLERYRCRRRPVSLYQSSLTAEAFLTAPTENYV